MKNNAIQSDDDFKCKYCNTFTGKNKASLGAHIRNCKSNPKNKDFIEICTEIITIDEKSNPIEVKDVPIEKDKKVKKNKK